MSIAYIVALILFVIANAIVAVKSIQPNSLPDPLFLLVDSAVVLFLLGGH